MVFVWEVHVLDNWFLWMKHGTLVLIRNAKDPHALNKNPLHLSKIGVWSMVSRKWTVGTLFFEQALLEILSKSQTLLEESEQHCSFQQDWATVHIVNTTPFLQDFLQDYTVRCGLWPHNLHTSQHPDFCVDLLKKKSTAIIQEEKKMWMCLTSRKWGAFSASAVIKHILLCAWFLALYIK
jgi:hypothetical protein